MKTALMLAGLALAGVSSHAFAADNCTVKIKANDAMQYDLKTATVSASCPKITIELTHTGKMPVAAMGHNVVIAPGAQYQAVANDGMKAGAAANYVPKNDPRVIASTALVGGGQSTKTTFPGSRLKAGGDYSFFCTFPGHAALMHGKLVVVK